MTIFMPIGNKLFSQAATAGDACGFIAPRWRDCRAALQVFNIA
jgi:hypothetical protein